MKKKRVTINREDKIWAIILVILNLIVPIELIRTGYRINNFRYDFIAGIIIYSIFIYVFYFNKKIKRLYKFLATVGLLCILGMVSIKNLESTIQFIEKNFIDTALRIWPKIMKNAETAFVDYKYIFMILIPIIVVCLLVLVSRFKKSIIVLNFIFIIVFWYLYQKEVLDVISLYLFTTLLSIFIITYSNIKKASNESKLQIRNNIKIYILYGIVISFLAIKVVDVLPKDYKGVEGKYYSEFFKNAFSKDVGIEISLLDSYTLKSSGYYNGNKKLGGPIKIDKKHVLTVNSKNTYYLKGSIKENYNGQMWKTKYDSESYILLKPNDIYNPGSFNKKDSIENLSLRSIKITPTNNLKTTSFFVADKTREIRIKDRDVYCNEVPTFISNKEIKDTYNVIFYVNPFESEVLSEKLKVSSEDSQYYQFWQMENEDEKNNFDAEEIMRKNYSEYLKVDNIVPRSVYDLTYNIIEDCSTIEEKAMAIEKYLSDHYEYSLDVSELPTGEEFTQYFLFEEKKGYCTYFATASAIMCRIAGIPSRYVEGFKMDEQSKNSRGEYRVTNGEAHAWCEILTDGKNGTWKIVDPATTPTEFERLKQKEKEKNKKLTQDNSEEMNESLDKNNRNKSAIEENEVEDSKFYLTYNDNEVKNISIIITISIYVLLKIRKYLKGKKYILESDSIIPMYNYYMIRLKSIGILKDDAIGDKEFLNTLQDGILKEKVSYLVDESYKEFYGGIKCKSKDKKEYMIFIENYIKENENIIKYYIKKYFINIK